MKTANLRTMQEIGSRGKRGWISRKTWPVTHYLVTNLSVTIGYLFFRFLNWTTISGGRNVPKRPNTLLLSNHQSMIDSFLVGLCAFYPRSLVQPFLIPWNPAAEENFYRTRILAWLADNWKCIPIKKGRKDVGSIHKMAEAMQTSPLTLFPEGTRSRDGTIGKGKGGGGLLILETRPTVVPVCIDGMDRVLPIGARVPRVFKRVRVRFGEPLDLSEFYDLGPSRKVAQAIMDRVMDSIRALRRDMDERN